MYLYIIFFYPTVKNQSKMNNYSELVVKTSFTPRTNPKPQIIQKPNGATPKSTQSYLNPPINESGFIKDTSEANSNPTQDIDGQ